LKKQNNQVRIKISNPKTSRKQKNTWKNIEVGMRTKKSPKNSKSWSDQKNISMLDVSFTASIIFVLTEKG
jgi:hypothetical protein